MSEKLRKLLLDHNYPRLLAVGVVVVFVLMVAACWLQACVPYPSPTIPPTLAPTITQAAPITHIPTRTITPTWTPTPSYSPTTTRTPSATSSPTATAEPSSSAEPSASPTPTLPLLPHTGASKAGLTRIAETATVTATSAPSATPTGEIEPPALPPCAVKWKVVYYHWEAGEWTMKLRCPVGTPKPEAGL